MYESAGLKNWLSTAVARIFTGMAPGWTSAKGEKVAPEDIAANLEQICNTDGFTIPDSIAGEMQAVMEALKARG